MLPVVTGTSYRVVFFFWDLGEKFLFDKQPNDFFFSSIQLFHIPEHGYFFFFNMSIISVSSSLRFPYFFSNR